MFPPLFQVAAANATVRSLLGTEPVRLYPFGEASDSTVKPYAVWQMVYGSPENALGDAPDMDHFGTQVDVYATTAQQARDVARALREAFENSAHVTAFNGESREPVTRDFRYSFTVDWFVQR